MILKLYNFSKKVNSTKVPASDTATELNVTLKENVSLYSPSFILSTEPNQFNYCQLDDKYYYINDYVYVGRNTFIINCTLDVLATYKTDILKTKAFVLYSTSNYDIYIPDNRLSQKAEATWANKVQTSFQDATGRYFAIGDEQYVVTYIGTVVSDQEGTPTMVLSKTQLKELINQVNSTGFAQVMSTGFWHRLLSNASEAIVRVTKIPFHPVDEQNEARLSVILAGSYSTGIRGIRPHRNVIYTGTIEIPWQHKDFRDTSRYTSLLMYLPAIGWVNLNADDFIGYDNLSITISVDEVTGTLSYTIGKCMTLTGCCGTDIPVSTIKSGVGIETLASIGAAAVQATTGNVPAAIASGFNAFASSMQKSVGSFGGYTSANSVYANPYQVSLHSICHNTNIEPATMAEKYGRPLNKVVTLSTLSGYCQTTDASVEVNASNEIIEEINNLLNGGVYIE